MRAFVRMQRVPVGNRLVPELALGRERTVLDVLKRLLIHRDKTRAGTGLNRHVAERHAAFH